MAQTPGFIQTLVTSTRIRLARNLAAYPFPEKLDGKLAAQVVYLVEKELGKLDEFQKIIRCLGKLYQKHRWM